MDKSLIITGITLEAAGKIKTVMNHLMRIVKINVEGMTRVKAETISHMFHGVDILALQEPHISDYHIERLKIPSFQLIDFIGHNKHGVATFVNQNLDPKNIKSIEGNKQTVGIVIRNTNIFNVPI